MIELDAPVVNQTDCHIRTDGGEFHKTSVGFDRLFGLIGKGGS
jgi:hypothetical protein